MAKAKLGIVDRRYPIDYSKIEIPPTYRCLRCGAMGVKLWRDYNTSVPEQVKNKDLVCAHCAAADQDKDIRDIDADGTRGQPDNPIRTNQIGWYVPAVPIPENTGFWGLTSIPAAGWAWWRKLPTLPAKIIAAAI